MDIERHLHRTRAVYALCALAALPLVGFADVSGIATAIDSHTVQVNGEPFRLYGIESVSSQTVCRNDVIEWACGMDAYNALAVLLNSGAIACAKRMIDTNSATVVCYQGTVNVNARLVAQGWARSNPPHVFATEERDAMIAGRGLWRAGFMPGDRWRLEHIPRASGCDVCALRRQSALRNRRSKADE